MRKSALSLVACGGGGVTGLRGALAAAGAELPDVRHGLVRVTERIDNSDTVKFCFVTVAPSAGVAPGRQGRIGTVRGRAVARFRPYHGDVTVNVAEELTEDGVMGAVSNLRAGNKGTTWS